MSMRICSLVPGATEIVALLGFGDALVGISHECDYPASLRGVPVVVQPVIDSGATSSDEIDQQVKALASSGRPLYRVDVQALAEARPDLILTQDVCHVCAVTPGELEQAIRSLPYRPQILTLAPQSLDDVIDDVERIGAALGVASLGRDLCQSLRSRIAAVRSTAAGRSRPRVACLEWLTPLYVGGHWVPDIVETAGGQDVLGEARRPSRQVTLEEVRAGAPEIVVLMPCGFSLSRTVAELTALCRTDAACSDFLQSASRTYAVDAGSYFSRPGPRLVDGLELMAEICGGMEHSNPSDSVLNLTGHGCLAGHSL
jgi:iron complex transport system substrate-binding protein